MTVKKPKVADLLQLDAEDERLMRDDGNRFDYAALYSDAGDQRFHDIDFPTPPLSPEVALPPRRQAPLAADPFSASNPYVAADPFRPSLQGGTSPALPLPPTAHSASGGAAQRAAGLPEGLPPPGYPAGYSASPAPPTYPAAAPQRPPPPGYGAAARGVPLDATLGGGSGVSPSDASAGHAGLVAQLCALTHEPEALCLLMLRDHGFDLDGACDAFFNGAYSAYTSHV
jgi:hypothetical protein